MDLLSSKTISEKDAAKILKKFVDAKEEEENTDLMVRLRHVCVHCDLLVLRLMWLLGSERLSCSMSCRADESYAVCASCLCVQFINAYECRVVYDVLIDE